MQQAGSHLARQAVQRGHDGQRQLPPLVRGAVDHLGVLQRLVLVKPLRNEDRGRQAQDRSGPPATLSHIPHPKHRLCPHSMDAAWRCCPCCALSHALPQPEPSLPCTPAHPRPHPAPVQSPPAGPHPAHRRTEAAGSNRSSSNSASGSGCVPTNGHGNWRAAALAPRAACNNNTASMLQCCCSIHAAASRRLPATMLQLPLLLALPPLK